MDISKPFAVFGPILSSSGGIWGAWEGSLRLFFRNQWQLDPAATMVPEMISRVGGGLAKLLDIISFHL
jgi:hypothetical protein